MRGIFQDGNLRQIKKKINKMDLINFENWFFKKVSCIKFLDKEMITEFEARSDLVIINCFGFHYHLFHEREYKLYRAKLVSRKELLGGKGGYFMTPIQKDLSIESLRKAVQIGLEAYESDLSLILHCRSGLHRSEMVRGGIYFCGTGNHLREANKENMLLENVQEKHNMFPVGQSELEEILIKTKIDYDGTVK